MLAAMQFLVCVLLVVVLSCSKHQVYGQGMAMQLMVGVDVIQFVAVTFA